MKKEELELIRQAAHVSGWYKRSDANVLKQAYNIIVDNLNKEKIYEEGEAETMPPEIVTAKPKRGRKKGVSKK